MRIFLLDRALLYNIYGLPLYEDSIFIKGAGPEYGALLAGGYYPANPKDTTIANAFPYQNDITSGTYFWWQTSIPSPMDLANAAQVGNPDADPVFVTFEIYKKQLVECGYPKKKGVLSDKEIARNGVCGLEKLHKTIITIDKLNPGKNPKNTFDGLSMKAVQIKQSISDKLKDLGNSLIQGEGNLFAKLFFAFDNYFAITQIFTPALMELLPDKSCINKFCETYRKAKSSKNISGIFQSMQTSTEAAMSVLGDYTKEFMEGTALAIKGIAWDLPVSAADRITKEIKLGLQFLDYALELDTDLVYRLCPRRLNDWASDAKKALGIPEELGILEELSKKFSENVVGNLFKALSSCSTEKVFANAINNAKDIGLAKKQEIINAFNNGDFNTLSSLVSGTSIQNGIMNSVSGLVDLTNLLNLSGFSPDRLNSMANAMIKELIMRNINSLTSGILDKFSNIQFVKNQMERTIFKYTRMLNEFNI